MKGTGNNQIIGDIGNVQQCMDVIRRNLNFSEISELIQNIVPFNEDMVMVILTGLKEQNDDR